MVEDNSDGELGTALLQSTSDADVIGADQIYRYDGIGSTTPRRISTRSLLGGYLEGSPAPSSDEADAAAGTKSRIDPSLTGFVLAVILFFNAGGGPFGVEPSLKAAGNFYAIIGFGAMPLLWALPEALMTYELSVLYPCASGGVRWTEEAFGEAWGLLQGYLGWIAGVTNNATFPVLFLSYVHTQFFPHKLDPESNEYMHYGILVGITVVLTLVNYLGLDVVGKASVLMMLVSLAPFLLMVIIGIPKVDPSKWLQTPTGEEEIFDDDALSQKGWFPGAYLAGIAFRPFINNLYWNFNGFDQGGHFSTSVHRQTLRNGIAGSLLMVSSSYLLPILIATGATDITQDEWSAGSFARAGTDIGGRWLGNWIVVGSGISLLAQYISGMSADAMQIQGMAERGQLPSLFGYQSHYNTPTFALLLGLLVVLLLLPLPFSIIVELSNFSFSLSVMAEFSAFVELRIRKGDCGLLRKLLYAAVIIAPILFNVAVILLASYATYIYGAVSTIFGVILIYAKILSSKCGSICCGGASE